MSQPVIDAYFEAGIEFGIDLSYRDTLQTGKSNLYDANLAKLVEAEKAFVEAGYTPIDLTTFRDKGYRRMMETKIIIGATSIPDVELAAVLLDGKPVHMYAQELLEERV